MIGSKPLGQIMDDKLTAGSEDDDEGVTLGEILAALKDRLALLICGPLAAGLLSFGITMLVPPTFTAVTTFMPPQQAQSAAASALASLGSLATLAGGATGVRSSGEQYIGLMQSITVSNRLIDQFKLLDVYAVKLYVDARKELGRNVRMLMGKKDGLVTIEVDDKSATRAAEIANQYVEELRHLTGTLAVTEAQQRRVFFERQLQQSRDRLVAAQQALQASGFNASALKAEPKAAAEGYARIKAEATAADVRLQILRGSLAESTPEIRQQQALVAALNSQLQSAERANVIAGGPDYIGRYRDFKYQETLFELYARQFELARVDESREGAIIQVIDPATPPERKSKPSTSFVAIVSSTLTFIALFFWVLLRKLPYSYRSR